MKESILAAVALAAISTAPAMAAPKLAETPADAAAPVAKTSPKPTRYCFDTEMTGSRIAKRVCQTREEWRNEGVEVPVKN